MIPKVRKASIIIRNYNGKELLMQFLPAVMEAVHARGDVDEVILVDDGSTDGSDVFVARSYPAIKLIRIMPNSGNSIVPVNVGVRAAKNDVVICLDNDVKVDKNFITPLLMHFDHQDIFAVCSKIHNPTNGMRVESFNYPRFHKGRLLGHISKNSRFKKNSKAPVEVWYAPGNGAAYDKAKFLAINGLDPIFRPIYCEDVDVCYRAWKRGWRTICEPASITYHLSHKTTRKNLKAEDFEIVRLKNQFVLTWKNLQDLKLICEHIAWTLARSFISLLMRDFNYLKGLCLALRQMPEILDKRRKMANVKHMFSDKNLFKRLQLQNEIL